MHMAKMLSSNSQKVGYNSSPLRDLWKLLIHLGAHTYRQLPPLSSNCTDIHGNSGWLLELFEPGRTDKPTMTINEHKEAAFIPFGIEAARGKDLQLSSTFVPTQTGQHFLACSGLGPTVITINEHIIYEQKGDCIDYMAFLLGGVAEREFNYSFTKGVSYQIVIRTKPTIGGFGLFAGLQGARMGFMYDSDHAVDLLSEAVEVAKECDYAIVFTGHTPVWETEGQDQSAFNLPKDGSQDRLVDAVASVNANTIVVNSTGVAIAMPWVSKVPAIIQTWFVCEL